MLETTTLSTNDVIVKRSVLMGPPNSFRRYDKCNMPPFPPYGAMHLDPFTSYRYNRNNCLTDNKDPTKNVYLVHDYIQENTVF